LGNLALKIEKFKSLQLSLEIKKLIRRFPLALSIGTQARVKITNDQMLYQKCKRF
jgi:ABC-type arginine transport system ATPase subunit